MRLTKQIADNASPRSTRYVLWDDELAGFGLRVTPAGSRSWVVKYRAGEGGRRAPIRWLSLGSYPILGATQARAVARKALAEIELGGDPSANLTAKRKEMTIAALIDLYESEGLVVQRGVRIGMPMKPLTARYTLSRLRNHVLPLIGNRKATEITEGDIEMLSRAISIGKTARDEKRGLRSRVIVRGGDGAARKVVRDMSTVFAFAMRRKIVVINPVVKASVRKTDNRRERFLSIDEIHRLGAALDELDAEGVNPKATNIVRLWVLSGCRRNEIAGLKWSEIDFDEGCLNLEFSKTGRSKRQLGEPALTLLRSLREAAPPASNFVFAAERGLGFYNGTKRVFAAATARAGLENVTPHVLRHTFGSAAASSGEGLLMIGSLLGHANARSTARYAHISHDPARLAADRITGPLATALGR